MCFVSVRRRVDSVLIFTAVVLNLHRHGSQSSPPWALDSWSFRRVVDSILNLLRLRRRPLSSPPWSSSSVFFVSVVVPYLHRHEFRLLHKLLLPHTHREIERDVMVTNATVVTPRLDFSLSSRRWEFNSRNRKRKEKHRKDNQRKKLQT